MKLLDLVRLAKIRTRKVGKRTKFWFPHWSNIGACTIGADCVIHSHVWIADKVVIGDRVRIQAFAFIPEGVKIEDDVFIGPHVCFTNDRHPPSPNWEMTIVKKGASIGAGTIILSGIVIGENAVIGAGAVVTKEVMPSAVVVGNPARTIRHSPKRSGHPLFESMSDTPRESG